ncbi:hypothetical protein Pcinc_030848 [Petrolisthes cinctipes]|uniref:Uncharacterized protein n=1 Tax=Petrolisthes cinctipes TaxID=88211 RepID=A0AAE1EXV4_PETCI|nr:hypothetical protein Pcinc_030848 [Petrolisthes cinctipes]
MRQLKENKRKENSTITKDVKKGKRFIDCRCGVVHTLKVLSTNQHNPLVTDDNVPQAVLQHTQQRKKNKKKEEQETYWLPTTPEGKH